MVLIDGPYISRFLAETLEKNRYPVLRSPEAEEMLADYNIVYIDEKTATRKFAAHAGERIYTNSENTLGLIDSWAEWYPPAAAAGVFKDKFAFRRYVRHLYPDFFYRQAHLEELDRIAFEELPNPCIIKPAVGFFSLGVHWVNSSSAWDRVRKTIKRDAQKIQERFPRKVLESERYIIEECIEGDEYALDAYFDEEGQPVVLGVYEHLFSSAADVSDRVYTTSKTIVRSMLERSTKALQEMNRERSMRNFPFHAEMRISEKHGFIPIEINPLRFGGWCTTADLAAYAYGYNQYEYYLTGKAPEWDRVLEEMSGDNYSIIVLDNSTGYTSDRIHTFSADAFTEDVSGLLEFRPVDAERYDVFAFVFARTPAERMQELYDVLASDLKKYVTLK